ncbi:hypothetical protein U0D24_21915 [Hafnia paralvei]|uniref:hypothetical protein n=1 Tax=Hafnia paralvei TaxID=546367 RepID=UPI002FDC0317
MATKLGKKPTLGAAPDIRIGNAEETTRAQRLAKFISEGDKRPSKNEAKRTTFRLTQAYIDLIDAESESTNLNNRTLIIKAALLAFDQLDQNAKNICILNEAKSIAGTGNKKPVTFRFIPRYSELLENLAEVTGVKNMTTILKASVLSFNSLTENEKNIWLIEAMKD